MSKTEDNIVYVRNITTSLVKIETRGNNPALYVQSAPSPDSVLEIDTSYVNMQSLNRLVKYKILEFVGPDADPIKPKGKKTKVELKDADGNVYGTLDHGKNHTVKINSEVKGKTRNGTKVTVGKITGSESL